MNVHATEWTPQGTETSVKKKKKRKKNKKKQISKSTKEDKKSNNKGRAKQRKRKKRKNNKDKEKPTTEPTPTRLLDSDFPTLNPNNKSTKINSQITTSKKTSTKVLFTREFVERFLRAKSRNFLKAVHRGEELLLKQQEEQEEQHEQEEEMKLETAPKTMLILNRRTFGKNQNKAERQYNNLPETKDVQSTQNKIQTKSNQTILYAEPKFYSEFFQRGAGPHVSSFFNQTKTKEPNEPKSKSSSSSSSASSEDDDAEPSFTTLTPTVNLDASTLPSFNVNVHSSTFQTIIDQDNVHHFTNYLLTIANTYGTKAKHKLLFTKLIFQETTTTINSIPRNPNSTEPTSLPPTIPMLFTTYVITNNKHHLLEHLLLNGTIRNKDLMKKNKNGMNSLQVACFTGKYSSEGAAREWSTVVIVTVIFIS